MKNLMTLFVFGILFCCTSCNNDEDVLTAPIFDKTVSFSFDGNTYTSNYAILDNDKIVYEDKQIQKIADNIQQLPELFTYYRSSGVIEYYNSYKDYINSIPQTRAVGNRYTTWGKLTIYDGTRWNNWAWGFWIDETTPYVNIPDLDGYHGGYMNFDKKISSFEIETHYKTFEGNTPPPATHGDQCRVIFFSEKNFSGKSASWEGDPFDTPFKRSFEAATSVYDNYNNYWRSLVFTFSWHQ